MTCTRRDFLGAGLLAATLPCASATALFAMPPSKGRAADGRQFLFLDWFHVQKGELKISLDPERINAEGKKLLQTYERDFNKTFDQSGHGFKSDAPFGVRITQEVAKHSKPWLVADQPWEKSVSTPTVLFDEGRYRCWYVARLKGEREETTVDKERVMSVSGSALAYAESTDGEKWVKPKLKILSFQGSRDNNLVAPFNNGGAVFRDDHGPPEERYKGFQFDKLPIEKNAKPAGPKAQYGLYGVTSPDGYHWTQNPKPLIRYFADTTNIAVWDPLLEKYVGFFRHHLGGRAISRAETPDFWNWPEPQPLLYAGPMDSPADDYYTNCYTTYPGDPSLRLIFPAIYHHDNDSVDIRLGVSRDGRAFQWVSHKPIIRLGSPGEWDCGSIYAEPQLVQLPDGRLALPYGGYDTTHNEVFFQSFYGDYGITSGAGWAIWKDARLAGIEAVESGQFAMQSTTFNGKEIQINARTLRSGMIACEVRQKGQPVNGFSFDDCLPFSGDEIWTPCRWKGKSDTSELRGKSIEVRFRLRSAKIFACKFV
jgi:hypothetical protein